MTINEAVIFTVRIAGLSLLWASIYLMLARVTPLEAIPGILHPRVLRTRLLAPYVAAASLLLLVGASFANLWAGS